MSDEELASNNLLSQTSDDVQCVGSGLQGRGEACQDQRQGVQTCAFIRCHAGGVRTFEIAADVQDDERAESIAITLPLAFATISQPLADCRDRIIVFLIERDDLTSLESFCSSGGARSRMHTESTS